jgi:hypothetical protein
MSVLRLFDSGRNKRDEAARLELEAKLQNAIDERRRIFSQPLLPEDLTAGLQVTYENKLLRSVVAVIRALEARYDNLAVAKPMDELAHEMTARKAALWDLEEELLGRIDEACKGEDGEREGKAEG